MVEPEDARYGVQDEDGSWNGMIGSVIKGVNLAGVTQ